MKHIRKAAAPIGRRASFQNPLSFPGVRFMSAGGDGGELGAGGAPAGDGQEAQGGEEQSGQNGTPSAPDPSNDGGEQGEEHDEQTGSQADDPKLRAARDEAYKNRQKANVAAQEKADLIQTLGKALGLVKDDDEQGKGPDAEALAAQIADEQAKATSAARELAVYKAAASAGGDPEALLDSRRFLDSISGIDPSDGTKIADAIKAAVNDNQNLASRRAPGASTADTASGPGGGSAPKAEVSLEDAAAAHYRN